MTNNAIDSNIPIEISKGGTGQSTLNNNSVLLGNGSSPVATVSVGATNTVLNGNTASAPTFGQLPVAAITNGSNGQLIIGGGSAPAWATLTAGANIAITTGANTVTIGLTGVGSRFAANLLYWQGSPFFLGTTRGFVVYYGTGFSTVFPFIAKFVAPTTGYYKICFTQGLDGNALAPNQIWYQTANIYYNGSTFKMNRWQPSAGLNIGSPQGLTMIYIYLVAGDELRNTQNLKPGFRILPSSGGPIYANYSYFTASAL